MMSLCKLAFFQEFFFGGGAKSIVTHISIIMLILLCFRTKFLERGKSLWGGELPQGVLCPPLEEIQVSNIYSHLIVSHYPPEKLPLKVNKDFGLSNEEFFRT